MLSVVGSGRFKKARSGGGGGRGLNQMSEGELHLEGTESDGGNLGSVRGG